MKNCLRLLTVMLLSYSSVFGQIFSTKGTDFWFGFMENYVSPTPTVYISSDVATSGTISIPGQTFTQPFTVAANSTTAIVVPLAQAHVTTNQVIESKAVHVVSNDPVTVYALNYEAYSSDASIVLPTNTLGIEYYTANVNPTVSTGTYPSEILIVGIQNGSTIEITPSVATNGGNAAGVPFNITLNQGETYQIQASGDLTGTYIQSLGSCEKFAIFAGAQCTNVGGCPYCDHLSEQMYPISTWGLNYAISPLQTRSADIYRIIAANAGTNVTINGGAPITLGAGQFNQQTLTPASFISADQPIMVVQYSRGGDCDGANADPFTIVLSPVEQTLDNITFNAFNSSVISSYFVNIISKTSTKNSVTLDGAPIGGFFNTIGSNPTYSYAQMSITQGNHTIDADSGAIATVYGYGSYESYGYVAGASLNNLGVSYNADAQGVNYGFSSIPTAQICANSQVDFHGETGPYTVLSWDWDFGDGNNAMGQNPSHTYTADGTYIVTLTSVISNLCLNDTVVVQQTVNVQNMPPPTTVTPSPLYMCPGDAVQLNVMSSNGGATHLWSDATVGTSTTVSPPVDSIYTVTTSWYGCTQVDSVFVDVRDPGTVPACNVIYVTPTGTGVGTQASPTDLLTALTMSNCNGALIRMAIGTYNFNNPISTISSFTTIEGGFDDGNGWQKTSSPGATTINRTSANLEGPANAERMVAIYGNGIHDFRLQDLTITTAAGGTSASGSGVSTYGMHLTAAYNYEIVRCQVQAGAAGAGQNGTNGANGTTGANGGNGQAGDGDDQSGGGIGGGGNGGNGGGAANGGNGGASGGTGANPGLPGGAPAGRDGGGGGGGADGGGEDRDGATGGTGGSGNAGGTPGQESGCNGGNQSCTGSISGGNANQAAVANGTNGTNGTAGAAGAITAAFWIPGGAGTNGTDGTGGEGGGGGGSGAGEGGTWCVDGHGSGGGGGGGGGQGGAAGTGGNGGGSAYSIYLFNNGINGNIINSNINAGAAGAGGTPGNGGNGGNGGNAGMGSNYNDEVGCGGDGADGGDGGDAGNGGSGAPGQSIDIVLDGGTALATSDDAFNLVGQAVISVDNVTCTMTSTDFAGPSSSAWNVGAGSTPTTATSNTITTQYGSTGFKDIDFGSDTYTGFVNIVVSGSGLAPIIGSTATLYGTDYHVCVGDAADFIALSSGINYNYFWDFDNAVAPSMVSTTNDTVPNLVFNTPGTYNITLQIQTPCCGLSATTASVTLIVDALPNPTIAANPGTQVCYGDSVELTVSGGTAYLWTTGETTPSIFVTPGDTMTVGVSATTFECSANTSIFIDPIISSVYISGIDQICSGDQTTLTANGMPGSTYTWSGPVSASTASITDGQLTDEWYYVEADLMGCLSYDSMQVLVTGVSAQVNSTDTTVCIGDSILLTVQGGSYYNWSTGSTNDSIYVYPISDTIFQVVVAWDSVGTIACNTTDTAYINVLTFLVPNISNVSADTLSCTGDTLNFTASGGNTYIWSTGETTQSISPVITSDSIFTVNSVNMDGCLSITDTIVVTTLPGVDSVNFNITNVSCYGFDDGAITSTLYGGIGPFDYLWNNGETSTSIDTLVAGGYSLLITAANGCTYTEIGVVNQPDSIVAEFTATPDSGLYPLEVTFTNMSYNGVSYDWDFNNGITSNNINEVVMFDTGAVYNVMLIAYDALGCSDTAYYNINVVGQAVVVIPNIFTPNGDGANDLFKINARFIDTYQVNIFNRWGGQVAEYDWIEAGWDGRTLSGVESAEGVYYYIITATGYDGQEFEFNGHFRLAR